MMGTMNSAAPSLRSVAAAGDRRGEQLVLIPNADVLPRFRLSKDTRERGLRHVAEIRQLLAERAGTASTTAVTGVRVHHDHAA